MLAILAKKTPLLEEDIQLNLKKQGTRKKGTDGKMYVTTEYGWWKRIESGKRSSRKTSPRLDLDQDIVRDRLVDGIADFFDGNEWQKVDYFLPKDQPVTVHRWVIPRSELNRQRAKPVVSPWLRHLLEKQEHLGKINVTGKFLLHLERRRGGKKPKAPIWWIYEESEKLIKSKRFDQFGVALKLTDTAYEEWGLSEDLEITIDDIKNARRSINKR